MKRNRLIAYSAFLLCLSLEALLFGGCYYRQAEDAVKEKLTGDQEEEWSEEEVPGYDLSGDKEYRIGDTVTQTIGGESVEYTVTGIRIGKNLEEFGVDREACIPNYDLFVGKNGEPLGGLDTGSGETYVFLEAEICIKNVNSAGCGVPGETPELFLDVDIRTKSELETNNIHNQGLIYYSEHAQDEQRYFYFPLEKEEETTVKVLWSVRESDVKEPLYCVTGVSTSRDIRQMILLNPETE